jgi:hypothetical protein
MKLFHNVRKTTEFCNHGCAAVPVYIPETDAVYFAIRLHGARIDTFEKHFMQVSLKKEIWKTVLYEVYLLLKTDIDKDTPTVAVGTLRNYLKDGKYTLGAFLDVETPGGFWLPITHDADRVFSRKAASGAAPLPEFLKGSIEGYDDSANCFIRNLALTATAAVEAFLDRSGPLEEMPVVIQEKLGVDPIPYFLESVVEYDYEADEMLKKETFTEMSEMLKKKAFTELSCQVSGKAYVGEAQVLSAGTYPGEADVRLNALRKGVARVLAGTEYYDLLGDEEYILDCIQKDILLGRLPCSKSVKEIHAMTEQEMEAFLIRAATPAQQL